MLLAVRGSSGAFTGEYVRFRNADKIVPQGIPPRGVVRHQYSSAGTVRTVVLRTVHVPKIRLQRTRGSTPFSVVRGDQSHTSWTGFSSVTFSMWA